MKIKSIAIATLLFIGLGTGAQAAECSDITQINALYNTVAEGNASIHLKRQLQQKLGVEADGIWGGGSQRAYESYVNRCNTYTFARGTTMVDGVEITDYYHNLTTFDETPYEVCANQQVPIYGTKQTNADAEDILGGALIGGALGKVATDDNGGALVGALIGGAIANEKNKNVETNIIGYESKRVCSVKYKKSPTTETSYAYSTATFTVDGRMHVVEFKK